MPVRTCIICDARFDVKGRSRAITCEGLCAVERLRRYDRKYYAEHDKAQAAPKICIVCSAPFVTPRGQHKTCSIECRALNNQANKKAAELKRRGTRYKPLAIKTCDQCGDNFVRLNGQSHQPAPPNVKVRGSSALSCSEVCDRKRSAAYNKKWLSENPDRRVVYNERKSASAAANRDAANALRRDWGRRNPDKVRQAHIRNHKLRRERQLAGAYAIAQLAALKEQLGIKE